jgi:outer membrane protein TolC
LKSNFKSALASLSFGVLRSVAQEPRARAKEPQSISLSLEGALSRAVAAAPQVTRTRFAVRVTDAHRVGAGIIMPQNPRLAVDARPLVRGGSGSPGYGATLDFPLDLSGAPRARVREAERLVSLAQADLGLAQATARVRALGSYVHAQIADLRMIEADAALVVAHRVLDATERRVNAGAASELEVSSADLQVAELESARVELERARALSQMDLRDALDLDAEVALVLTSPVVDPPALGEVAGLVQRALGAHPELKALQARVELLRATEARLEAEVFPRLGLYAGIDAAPLSPTYGVLGVSVELPVAQRNQGRRAVSARERECRGRSRAGGAAFVACGSGRAEQLRGEPTRARTPDHSGSPSGRTHADVRRGRVRSRALRRIPFTRCRARLTASPSEPHRRHRGGLDRAHRARCARWEEG